MTPQTQHVLVTGAASGIGLAIARCFLATGARVHICDLDAAAVDAARQAHPGLSASVGDVGLPGDVDRLFAEFDAAVGHLDVLVNNAGIGGPRAALEDVDDADWERSIAVNLGGPFYCAKRAVRRMKPRRSGCILNISTGSVRTGLPRRTPYVASKYGVMGLTHNLARELGPHGIRCNAILPGLIDNPRGRALVARLAEERGQTEAETEQAFLRYISMRTWIDPEEIGETAVFLASRAGRHITGQFLGVCGHIEWEE